MLLEKINLRLSQGLGFWVARSMALRSWFWLGKHIFRFQRAASHEKDNLFTLGYLVGLTKLSFIAAIGFAYLLKYVDSSFTHYYIKFGIPKIADHDDYVTFLATIAGIGGVFIGLYYAAICAVGGAIYSAVPSSLRNLLAYERRGSVYMRYLAFVTFLCLTLIAFQLSGVPSLYSAVPVVTLFAGLGIFSFAKLGQEAFFFFDPTSLSGHIFEQLQHWMSRVKVGGYRWDDKSFQAHAFKNAAGAIDTLRSLCDHVASKDYLRGSSYLQLARSLVVFLINYEYAKRSIPTSSAWYGKRYEHPDWYLTDESQVSIAYQTGTSLQPVVSADPLWVEDRIIPLLKQCIDLSLTDQRYSDTQTLLSYTESYIKVLTREGDLGRAWKLSEEISEALIILFPSLQDGETEEQKGLGKLAVAEYIASFPISIALALREKILSIDRSTLEHKIATVSWRETGDIYRKGFPTYCLQRLEWFQPRLDFEVRVEGRSVTPPWYKSEMLRQVECERFSDEVKNLISQASLFYKNLVELAMSRKHHWVAAAITSRELEFWGKVEPQMPIWKEKWEELNRDRLIDELPWPTLDFSDLDAEVSKRRNELHKIMSQHGAILNRIPKPAGCPDFSGQFLHATGEAAFGALCDNDIELFKSVFPPYLYSCLMTFDRLKPTTAASDWRMQQRWKVASAVLLDLMDVSGYSKLFSDLHHDNSLWTIVSDTWGGYIEKQGIDNTLPIFSIAIMLTDGGFEIPYRSMLRSNWSQKVEGRLQSVPRKEHFSRMSLSSDTEIEHDSALVRVFAKDPSSFYDGVDIFVNYYLKGLTDQPEKYFQETGHDLLDSIEWEEEFGGRPGKQKENQ